MTNKFYCRNIPIINQEQITLQDPVVWQNDVQKTKVPKKYGTTGYISENMVVVDAEIISGTGDILAGKQYDIYSENYYPILATPIRDYKWRGKYRQRMAFTINHIFT